MNNWKNDIWEAIIMQRIKEADANPGASLSLEEVMGKEGYAEFLAMKLCNIPNEDLFV